MLTLDGVAIRDCDSAIVIPHDSRLNTEELRRAEGWAEIDAQLGEWLRDPSRLVDYDAVPPTRTIIRNARSFIPSLRFMRLPVPDMAVPDGNGGISFEFHSDGQNLNFLKNGELWRIEVKKGQAPHRSQWLLIGPAST